ncbi:MAG TPA: hypothetical protein VN213_03275 [Solirubrobacteraceae bacterium]|nr:hypothetical protein [Solirubrobacteraceae bacterium]
MQRAVAAVEREMERRTEAGIPPDPLESPLIAFAMDAGGTPDTVGRDPTPDTASALRDEQLAGRDGSALAVAVTGAFLAGRPLDARVDSYAELQRALASSLIGPEWRVADLRRREGGTFESGGGFTEDLPLEIARRDCADDLAFLSRAVDPRAQVDPNRRALPDEVREARPRSLDIVVYDVGVAVMTAWFDVVPTAGTPLRDIARAINRLVRLRDENGGTSPLVGVLRDIGAKAARQYGRAVLTSTPEELQGDWLPAATLDALEDAGAHRPPDEHGRLLWLHPILVLERDVGRRAAARSLAPPFCELIGLDEGIFAAGIGWSAVVVRPGSRVAIKSKQAAIELTELHWAYFALYMTIDRGLLLLLNQRRWGGSASLDQLEDDADEVFAHSMRVMAARARLDTHLSALGGDEMAIWETIARVQRFEPVVDGVERKLDVLEKVAKRRVELATAYRTRRLGDILGALTVLTVVTVAVALIGTFLGSRSPGLNSTWVRVAVVGVAALISLVIYWAAFIRTTRGRRMSAPWDES